MLLAVAFAEPEQEHLLIGLDDVNWGHGGITCRRDEGQNTPTSNLVDFRSGVDAHALLTANMFASGDRGAKIRSFQGGPYSAVQALLTS